MLLKIKFNGKKDDVRAYVRSRGMSCEQDVRDELNEMEQKIRAHCRKEIDGGFYPKDFNIDEEVGKRRHTVWTLYWCGGIYQDLQEEFIPEEGWVSYVILDFDMSKRSPQSNEHYAAVIYIGFLDGKGINYVSVSVITEYRTVIMYKDKKRKYESILKNL
jgi:hypothetical protein